MFNKNVFTQKDPIADLVAPILEAQAKAKMEELKGQQHKIDKNKNNKIDAHDFAILRGEKKAMKEEEQVEEGWDDMMKAAKERRGPQPSGGAGVKKGRAYGGAAQKSKPEQDDGKVKKEEVDLSDFTDEEISEFMQSEEYNQLDELSKEKLGWYLKKASKHMDKKGENMIKRDKKFKPGMNPLTRTFGGTSQRMQSIAQASKKYLAKEEEQIEERTLTPGETSEKERIVKGMKKNLAGFKARYGERAKSVMYATATKAAKKD